MQREAAVHEVPSIRVQWATVGEEPAPTVDQPELQECAMRKPSGRNARVHTGPMVTTVGEEVAPTVENLNLQVVSTLLRQQSMNFRKVQGWCQCSSSSLKREPGI